MTTDDWLLVGLLGLLTLFGGMVGGSIMAGLVLWARTRWPRLLLGERSELVLPVRVALHTDPVQLAVRVRQPEPVAVEVVTTGTPTTRELAARVIATFPTIGPTDLANIVQCSKSTAHAIIQEARAGRLALPDVSDPEEGEL